MVCPPPPLLLADVERHAALAEQGVYVKVTWWFFCHVPNAQTIRGTIPSRLGEVPSTTCNYASVRRANAGSPAISRSRPRCQRFPTPPAASGAASAGPTTPVPPAVCLL